MEEKKNSQVQALDDDALENVAGGKLHLTNYPSKEPVWEWECSNCGHVEVSTTKPSKCGFCKCETFTEYLITRPE